jgi:hypothetical protein
VRDVFKVYLIAGKEFGAQITTASAGADFDLFLFGPTARSVTTTPVTYDARTGSNESIYYDVKKSGWYYLDIAAYDGSNGGTTSTAGTYQLKALLYPVPYQFASFHVPMKAKKRAWFTVSVRVYPTYLRTSKAVTLVAQKHVGSAWKHTTKVTIRGKNLKAGGTKFKARAKLNSGTWHIRAVFKDVDHAAFRTAWKKVKIK